MPLNKVRFKPGINREISQYSNSGGWWDADKVRFRAGFPESIGGWTAIEPTPVSGVTRSIHEWSLLNGTLNLGIGSNSNYYILSGDAFHDITPAGFTPGPVDASLVSGWGVGPFGSGAWGFSPVPSFGPQYVDPLIWSADNFGENIILNPRGGPIYYWSNADMGYSTPSVRLDTYTGNDGKCPTKSNGIFVHPLALNVVALGCTPLDSTTVDPMQIRWSDLQTPLTWNPLRTNSAGGQRLQSGSRIIGHLNTFGETLVWTDTTLYAMRFSGNNFVFNFQVLADGCSVISPQVAISTGSSVFWMDRNSFSVYNGSVSELPCSLKSYVFDNLNRSQSWKCFAGHNRSFSEVWWFYPSEASNEVDSYVIFNYADNTWSKGSLGRTAWLDTGRLATPIAADAGGMLYFHESGITANGSPLNAWIESADIDISGGDQYAFLSKVIPDVQFLGSVPAQKLAMDILKRNSTGEGKVTERSHVISPNTRDIFTRTRGRRLSVRFSSSDTATAWRLGTTELEIQPNGRR